MTNKSPSWFTNFACNFGGGAKYGRKETGAKHQLKPAGCGNNAGPSKFNALGENCAPIDMETEIYKTCNVLRCLLIMIAGAARPENP